MFRAVSVNFGQFELRLWVQYKEREREVLRYGCDVRECLCEIERNLKGKTSLIHAYLYSASRKRW